MTALDELVARLDIRQIESNRYRSAQPNEPVARVFGGQMIAQALMAAYATVESRAVHSLQGYFVRPGDPSLPIDYDVQMLSDGTSFSVRRVLATQAERTVFSMSCSFHVCEDGEEHQLDMPDVPGPDDLPDAQSALHWAGRAAPPVLARLLREDRAIEFRAVDLDGMIHRTMRGDARHFWIRTRGRMPDRDALHRAVLGYASDLSILDVALHKHGDGLFDGSHSTASLDHVMWFHRPFRVDQWLLYTQDSPSRASARGFTRGSIFSRDGAHVASISQEGLLRSRAASVPLPLPVSGVT